jgi:hypothetical protein
MKPTANWFAMACLAGCLVLEVSPLHAEWIENGVGICTTVYSKTYPQIVSDGAGGAIITWGEYRTTWNVYAQRVDANGAVLWGSTGTAVCDFAGIQNYPLIVSDGAGGAIITWSDDRSGYNDVYVQRLDANGARLWTTDGVALSTATGQQYPYGIASDGAGGAIVSFTSSEGNTDAYAQRVSADGTVLWTTNGVAVCATTDAELYPRAVPDGAHGAIIVISKNISGVIYTYAGRVDAAGTVLWAAEGVPLCTAAGGQYDLKAVDSGAGAAIATWADGRNYPFNIYAQLVDTTGAIFWGATGAAVCTATDAQVTPQMAPDGAGGAIIAWTDSRSGTSDIYAQRMDASGTALWAADGIPVCAATDVQEENQIAADGAGGALVVWCDHRAGAGDYNICVQRIDGSGAPVWKEDGVLACAAVSTQQGAVVACDGAMGAIAAWSDLRSGSGAIYAHRENPIVATLLESYSAGVEGGCIELAWVLSEAGSDARFFIQRAVAVGAPFEEIANAGIERDGLSFSFADCSCEPGDAARYRVEVEENDGRRLLFETGVMVLPSAPLALFQNHPNPFNPGTTIGYYLPEAGMVALEIYDPVGRRVARLVDGVRARGHHEARWDGTNGAGAVVGSGVYFCRLTAGKETLTKKMVLLK